MSGFSIVKLTDPIQFTTVSGGLVPRGAYNGATTYSVGDSVDYNGSSYVLFSAAVSGTLPTDTTKWQVLANKGSTGASGSTGATGAAGADGRVQTVVAGTNVTVDATDPANPIVSASGGGGGGGTWGSITGTLSSQTDLQTALDAKQPLDSDLTTIAGLTATTDNFMVATASAWASRTPSQARTQLGLGSLATQSGTFSGTSSGTNTGDQDLSGLVPTTTTVNGHALSANVTVTKSDVSLGNVDNTSNTTERAAVAVLTNKDLTSGTNTFPTFNQNTTGSAAKLTTARNIDGQAFDGSADITVIAPGTHATTSKSTPVDADEIPLIDSAAGNVLKKLTWANLKATLKTYFDTLYQPLSSTLTSWSSKTVPTGNPLGDTDTQTVSGKTVDNSNVLTIKDGNLTLQNTTDTTKQAVFSASLISPGTTRTLSLPNNTTTLLGANSTATVTNKRNTRRVVAVTQSATPTINTDNTDVASITGLAQAITSMTTNLSGTPVDGDQLLVRITDNGTGRGITWGASFESSTVTLPTTTVASAMLTTTLMWNTATSKWRCISVA